MIGQKILQFDDSLDNSLFHFEKLFNVKIKGYPKDSTVEIMNLNPDGKRKVSINGDILLLDMNNIKKRAYDYKKKGYKYQASDINGNLLATDYTLKGLAKKLNISTCTVQKLIKNKTITKNYRGRPSKKFIIKKILMSDEERINNKTAQPKHLYEVFLKGKSVGKFYGQKETANKIGVGLNTLARYLRGEIKNKNGYTVKRVFDKCS